jgi:hypothetical protein
MQNAKRKEPVIVFVWLPPLGGREMPALIFRLKPETTLFRLKPEATLFRLKPEATLFRLKPEATHAIDGGAS